ncbi:sensor histidine kinase [Mycetocola reblochoni]|uniref:histidine kinase n=2 Tax=Mycetocola reblochoni TaxID=331618 RepID=A0A1R4KAA1_9MICO|nr:sensor histidine kinase [Mycetocola reblochoni]SJN41055.1 sensor histidine kinase [Mycetocola reblochoni REB411]
MVATWWYTFGSAMVVSVMVLLAWGLTLFRPQADPARVVLYAVGAVVWLVALSVLGTHYWRMPPGERVALRWSRTTAWTLIGALAAVAAGWGALSVTLACSLVAVPVCILPWPRGVRGRVTALWTVVIVLVAWVEFDRLLEGVPVLALPGWLAMIAFAMLLPATVVSMFWWWDIVRALDSARHAESRLAATQERLRMASDVHDLQGHHLQVIALQLELAERLIGQDAAAARDQLRAAQRSVDEARAGTRDLATRFRGVPLPDELANAADLLTAAGIAVTVRVDGEARGAPGEVLGPVVRESTTNILKHGGGRTAALELRRDGDDWLFRAVNDAETAEDDGDGDVRVGGHDGAPARDGAARREGSGIPGMASRVGEARGHLSTGGGDGTFVLEARVPRGAEGAA